MFTPAEAYLSFEPTKDPRPRPKPKVATYPMSTFIPTQDPRPHSTSTNVSRFVSFPVVDPGPQLIAGAAPVLVQGTRTPHSQSNPTISPYPPSCLKTKDPRKRLEASSVVPSIASKSAEPEQIPTSQAPLKMSTPRGSELKPPHTSDTLKDFPRISKARPKPTTGVRSASATDTSQTLVYAMISPPLPAPANSISIALPSDPIKSESAALSVMLLEKLEQNWASKRVVSEGLIISPPSLVTPTARSPNVTYSKPKLSSALMLPVQKPVSPPLAILDGATELTEESCCLVASSQAVTFPITPPPTPTPSPILPTTNDSVSMPRSPGNQISLISNPPTIMRPRLFEKDSLVTFSIADKRQPVLLPDEPMNTTRDVPVPIIPPLGSPSKPIVLKSNPKKLQASVMKDRPSASPLRPARVHSGKVKKSSPLACTMTDAAFQTHRITITASGSAPVFQRRTRSQPPLYMDSHKCNRCKSDGSRDCVVCWIMKAADTFCSLVDKQFSEMNKHS